MAKNRIKSLLIVLFIVIIAAVFVVGGLFYRNNLKSKSTLIPPFLSLEGVALQGKIVDTSKYLKYEASDVSNFTQPTNAGSSIILERGIHYFYASTSMSIHELTEKYIRPKDGLRLMIAYFNPSDGIYHLYPNKQGSSSITIPENGVFGVIALQSTDIWNVKSAKTPSTSPVSLDTSREGWVLKVANSNQLSSVFSQDKIPYIKSLWYQDGENHFSSLNLDQISSKRLNDYYLLWIYVAAPGSRSCSGEEPSGYAVSKGGFTVTSTSPTEWTYKSLGTCERDCLKPCEWTCERGYHKNGNTCDINRCSSTGVPVEGNGMKKGSTVGSETDNAQWTFSTNPIGACEWGCEPTSGAIPFRSNEVRPVCKCATNNVWDTYEKKCKACLKAGESCNSSVICCSGLKCSSSKKCVYCVNNADCNTGTCVNGNCVTSSSPQVMGGQTVTPEERKNIYKYGQDTDNTFTPENVGTRETMSRTYETCTTDEQCNPPGSPNNMNCTSQGCVCKSLTLNANMFKVCLTGTDICMNNDGFLILDNLTESEAVNPSNVYNLVNDKIAINGKKNFSIDFIPKIKDVLNESYRIERSVDNQRIDHDAEKNDQGLYVNKIDLLYDSEKENGINSYKFKIDRLAPCSTQTSSIEMTVKAAPENIYKKVNINEIDPNNRIKTFNDLCPNSHPCNNLFVTNLLDSKILRVFQNYSCNTQLWIICEENDNSSSCEPRV